ncbi:MAG: endonuclease/exonuclease/phosphatase family protein [Planctomycetes bacterium]|nr:endonuclease/exonuclease/phosphatase family protein [Planctomycetota bacterium]
MPVRVMSCNIRCDHGGDGANNWVHRRDLCVEVMQSRRPDILCCQEVWASQAADLRRALAGYAWMGTIDEPDGRGPVNSIFYRSDRFRPTSAGAYWLSQTPHVCGSRSWDSRCVRLATWARLLDGESGREVRIVNTHLDHVSQPAREGQAAVLNEDAAAYGETFAQILTGDMNAGPENPAIACFGGAGWRDTWQAARGEDDPGPTFHGFRGPAYDGPEGRIDWIFMRGPVRATAAEVVTDHRDGRYPSDHHFITADVEL